MDKCEHKIFWDSSVKFMVHPQKIFGQCLVCGRTCFKIGDKVHWEGVDEFEKDE